MKKLGSICCILLSGFVLNIVFIGCGGKATGADGTVIAEFEWDGKHHITLEEMMAEIDELPDYKKRQYKEKQELEEYMTLMAESRLILCLAKDQNLDEDAEILEKVHDYLHELMVDKLTELEVDQQLTTTEEDFRLYFEENKDRFVEPEQVRGIAIAVANKARAEEVLQQIKDGKDIVEVSKELIDRGEMEGPGSNPADPGATGFFSRHSYPEEAQPFVKVAFDLEVGQTSDEIIVIEFGRPYYMIFRKDEHKQERQQELEEEYVRRNVERAVERDKRKQLMQAWIERLRERAKVKTYIDRIPEAPKEDDADTETEAAEDGSSSADDSMESKSEEQ